MPHRRVPSTKPRIRLLATGGTISSQPAPDTGLPEPVSSAEQLAASLPNLEDWATVEVEDFSRVLSSELSIEQVYALGRRVCAVLAEDEGIAGVVVTHGTGTLEETAFMTDLLVDDPRPVVFTGAMRVGLSGDGPQNLLAAVRTAASDAARGKGVVVVMNGTVHAARHAYKAHTTAVDAFRSSDSSPLGYVYADRVHFTNAPLLRQHLDPDSPVFDVDLIKFAVGMDGRYIRASVAAGAAAIVIEGSGLANLNVPMAEGIGHALDQGTVVAICSRVTEGRVYGVYGTRASGETLRRRGCLLASLSGPKTRILLMLALGVTRDPEVLQSLLDWG